MGVFSPTRLCGGLLILSHLLSAVVVTDGAIGCRDQSGDKVDWWIVYKLPMLEDHPDENVRKGVGYLYVNSDTGAEEWKLSRRGIDSTRQMVAYTLKQMYDRLDKNSMYHVMYNDAPGVTSDTYRGHTKGFQAFSSKSGFWLIHSVPRFSHNVSYEYPDSGEVFGQTMLCVTFDTVASLQRIGEQLVFYQPNVFHSNLPLKFAQKYPALKKVIGKYTIRKAPFFSVQELTSQNGVKMTNFAKYKKFDKDLYADLVSTELSSSIYTETWLNGGNDLPSICNQTYKVHNLRSVKPNNLEFETSKDHSKWAVSTDANKPWVCIGGINRQRSQYDRAGGTMCLELAPVWRLFHATIGTVENCGESDQWVSVASRRRKEKKRRKMAKKKAAGDRTAEASGRLKASAVSVAGLLAAWVAIFSQF